VLQNVAEPLYASLYELTLQFYTSNLIKLILVLTPAQIVSVRLTVAGSSRSLNRDSKGLSTDMSTSTVCTEPT